MKHPLRLLVLLACAAPLTRALINPSFTPVQLVHQATDIWQADLTLQENETTLRAEVTREPKGTAPDKTFLLELEGRPVLDRNILDSLKDGKGSALFFRGDFEGGEEGTWAMVKLGTLWHRIVRGEDGALRFREDPIDLSTVWAGDVLNLARVVDYILTRPDADVPVRSGGRWAEERRLRDIEGTVTGMERVVLNGDYLVIVYREEGDLVISPAEEYQDVASSLGLSSASAHAAPGGFAAGGEPALMSLGTDGTLTLWEWKENRFTPQSTGLKIENVTDVAPVARPGRAALLAGTAEGMRVAEFTGEAWSLHDLPAPADGGEAGPVLALDIQGDGQADCLQAHAKGLNVVSGGESAFFEHTPVGSPLSMAPADFDGDGYVDLLIGGDRGAVLMMNDREGGFTPRLSTTGELAYNIRPGVNAIGTGDHNLDGREDLVLFNHQLPPQVYFNRGFGVFGYDMELDMIEDVPDAQYAAGAGQQAGLLADVTGNGLQEVLMVTKEGEFWLLVREETNPPPLVAELFPPASATGPVPLVIREGDRMIGARIAGPHSPAFVGRRNRGPIEVSWRNPGEETDTSQRVIVLRPEIHRLSGD